MGYAIQYDSKYVYRPTILSTHLVRCNRKLLHVTDTGDCEEDNVSLRGFDGGIVVINVRRRSSFTQITKWVADNGLEPKPVLLLAMGKRGVSDDEITRQEMVVFAREQGWEYMEEENGMKPFNHLAMMIKYSRRFEV